ncbi:MAG: arylsulfotransferase family protein, partial [bacterium]
GGEGIAKLDRDSNVLWASSIRAHHDLETLPDGSTYVLTRKAHILPRLHAEEPVLEDFITLLDPDGNELHSVSLIECFENSPYAAIFNSRFRETGDVLHTNTLRVLTGSCNEQVPWDQEGYILTCFRALDLIAVVDLKTQEVVMTKRGGFKAQHDPKLLPNGNLLLFDNKRGGRESRVLEFDPVSWQVVWKYEGTSDAPFLSRNCGLADRLPNGNTLIVETAYGRAFEVLPNGTIVWEFHNPDRAGDHDQYIATLSELIRLPLDYPLDWVQSPARQ